MEALNLWLGAGGGGTAMAAFARCWIPNYVIL
jgi:hypothetical protein